MRPAVLAAYQNNEDRRQEALRTRNVTLPEISGTAAAGNTLTVSDGTWLSRGNDDLTFSYQWYRDGAVIDGEVAATYDVVGGDSGSSLLAIVTAEHPVGRPGFRIASAAADAVTVA